MTAQAKDNHKKQIPPFRPGDTVRVHLLVVEGESERIQVYEGVVIRRRGKGVSETFTVRKTSFGVGVERTFPIHSPRIPRIELSKGGRSRRARLYYLRKLSGRASRLAEEERDGMVDKTAAEKPKEADEPTPSEAPAAGESTQAEAAPAA